MYLNLKKRNFYHGLMFHHFHDKKKHIKTQGSISSKDFLKIINFVGKENILDPIDFIQKVKNKTIKKNHFCITFDDNLSCQFDIALPILEKLNLKAFFFVYTNSLSKNPDLLEVFRYFRYKYYKNINLFYKDFNNSVNKKFSKKDIELFYEKNLKEINIWKKKFKIYSIEDIKFRFLRDKFLGREKYKKIMLNMFKRNNFNYKKKLKDLVMNKKQLIKVFKLGHEIGLHSFSHPTKLSILKYKEQFLEYKKNLNDLKNCLKVSKIRSMSHPNGSYTNDTLKILKKLKIEIGFKQNMMADNKKKINNSVYEIARNDHANIMSLLK